MISLFHDYKKFERIASNFNIKDSELDASNEYFLAPTTLIPLTGFVKTNNVEKIITHPRTYDYVKRILEGKETGTNTELIILPNSEIQRQQDETAVNMAENIDYNTFGGYRVIYHICNELINNIYNHTPMERGFANYGYTYSQFYPRERKLDICVLDDGLSIPGKFEKSNIPFEDDCDAIYKAINGVTTAKDKDFESRGNGLWSTIKLVVEGNGGSVLLVSREGCLHIRSKDNFKYYHLDNSNIFKGTLVSVRLEPNQVQHYYDLIEISDSKNYIYKKFRR